MGDFDEQIKSLRVFRDRVNAELESLERGERRIANGVDRTEAVQRRTQELLMSLDAAIAAYDSHNVD